jgi:dTDP-glucose 4,6-dehydratase
MTKQEYIFNKKNVIVTGGAGFLGSHLCDELLKTAKVICVDSFLSGQDSNIQHLFQNPDFVFIKHDISRPLRLEGVPELQRFDIAYQGIQEIYHLASPTAPADYLRLPIETMRASAFGTVRVLEWAEQYKASVVFASSAAVYGEPPDPLKPFVTEAYWGFIDPLGDTAAFTEGKRFAEALMHQYRLHRGVDAKIARLFNVYGRRMKFQDTRVIPSVMRQVLTSKEVVVMGDPEQKMSACYVRDAVDGLVKVMAAAHVDVVNIGNPEPHTLRNIVETILGVTGKGNLPVQYEKSKDHIVAEALPDISKVRDMIGWLPLIDLRTGVEKTWESIKASRTIDFSSSVTL